MHSLTTENYVVHIRQIEFRIYALAVQIHRHDHDIHIAGAFSIAEQSAFDPLGAGHDAEFSGGHGAAAVIVRMQADDDGIAAGDMAAEPFDLIRVNIGRRHFNRGRKIDDCGTFGSRLPHIDDPVAHLHGEIDFGAGKALGRVLECPLGLGRAFGAAPHFPGAGHGDIDDARLVGLENLFALHDGGRVVDVHDRLFRALEGLESSADQLRPGLCEHLDGHIIRYRPLFNKTTHKIEIRLGSRGESDFDLLESDFHQQIKHLSLLTDRHRFDEGLIAIAQVDATPLRRFGQNLIGPISVLESNRRKSLVPGVIKHAAVLSFSLVSEPVSPAFLLQGVKHSPTGLAFLFIFSTNLLFY